MHLKSHAGPNIDIVSQMRARGFQFGVSYKYLTSRMRKLEWFTHTHKRRHTHNVCSCS